MLYYTILYYTILYYIILHYTILYYTILYYTMLYYAILCYPMLYYIPGPPRPARRQRGAVAYLKFRLVCLSSIVYVSCLLSGFRV